MNILLLTVGTRGDVQPFVALGKGLLDAGHDVSLCTCARFEPFVVENGLGYAYMNNAILDLLDSAAGRDAMENTTNLWEGLKTYAKLIKQAGPIQLAMLNDCWAAAQEVGPDLILFHPKAFGGPHFAAKLGIPAVMASLMPLYAPTSEFPSFGFPNWNLGGWYNRATYAAVRKLTALGIGRYVKQWRKSVGYRGNDDIVRGAAGHSLPILHGYSARVFPQPSDWPRTTTVTGYWFLKSDTAWPPPPELLSFLDAGDPPVYIGFGSISARDPARTTRLVVDALQTANVRGILASGWGGLAQADLPPDVFQLEQAPHEWLFPRMAAVVHHGGAGTTAAGLRAGRPTVVCPFFGDQPAWGRRVHELGAGPKPIPQKQLTAEKLAGAIRDAVGDPQIRETAQRIGEQIRKEDGVANAVAFVEQWTRA